MSRIHFIGGEKGGVGKSVTSRLLAQYYIDREVPLSVFDGDQSHAAMLRFYQDFSGPLDVARFESLDQVMETALEEDRQVIVDLPAQSNRGLERWLADSGVVEIGAEVETPITLWHVMDDGSDSVRLLERLLETHGEGPDYVVVRNFGRGDDFSMFDDSTAKAQAEAFGAGFLDLPALHAPTMRHIDQTGASFWAAVNNKNSETAPSLGLLERQRVKVWLKRVYHGLDKLQENFSIEE